MRLNKGPLADFLGNIVKLIDSYVSICKAAAGSLDVMKTKVMETQNQLIERQKEDIAAVKNTVKTEIKSWADVVKKNVTQDRQFTAKSVKEAVKAVNEEEERSKNLIIYGIEEIEDGDWDTVLKVDPLPSIVKSISEQINCSDCDIRNFYRIGNKAKGKVRPIKVEFLTSNDITNYLKNAHKLKSNESFKSVYLAPDRSLEQRVAHHKLVIKMKELIKNDNSKHYFIRDNKVKCADKN
jgi:gas vesicle protein